MNKAYRTLVRGRLRQDSSLCVGGTLPEAGGAKAVCARDGLGRLVIPGTALAGCLIDTAARVLPRTFAAGDDDVCTHLRRVTSKRRGGAPRETWESLWRFRPAHRTARRIELRQGVGIRHDTGAAADEGGALFDVETLPPGQEWGFFLEIDSGRGGAPVEGAALYALHEWAAGRCWLGAGAARGLGWMTLVEPQVLRLPAEEEFVRLWPDSSRSLDELWDDLCRRVRPEAELLPLARRLWGAPPEGRACIVVLEVAVRAGQAGDGYGLDGLSVGTHAASLLEPLGVLAPLGMRKDAHDATHEQDSPVATSAGAEGGLRAVLPGSGLRGPLRHAASRLARSASVAVPDPNTRAQDGAPPREGDDPVSRLFGLTGHSARLLVSDGRPTGDCVVACWQHHAEDEFAASVYGGGKFDRTAVIGGDFTFRLAVEAPDAAAMRESLGALGGALRLAELGYVPVGGAKNRGAGWAAWEFRHVEAGRAGDPFVTVNTAGGVVQALRRAAALFEEGGR